MKRRHFSFRLLKISARFGGVLRLSVILTLSLFALDAHKRMSEFGRDVWTTREGLPHDGVRAIVQSAKGYLWLGTTRGVARFDGVRFVNFTKTLAPQMASDFITHIVEDNNHQLWIAAGSQLLTMKDNRLTTTEFARLAPHRMIRALCVDRAGRVWIGADNQVWIYSDQRFQQLAMPSIATQRDVLVIKCDRAGRVWIGAHGLTLWQAEAADTNVNQGFRRTYTTQDGLPDNGVSAIDEDAHGALWVGTYEGAARFSDNVFTAFTTRHGLTGNGVRAVACDRRGAVWIGTIKGVNRIFNDKVETFVARDGLANNYVNTIYQDRENNIWIGTAGGLQRLNENAFTTFTSQQGLAGDYILTLTEGADGAMWFGTHDAGISVLQPDGTVKNYNLPEGLPHGTVRALYRDVQGTIWAGTYQGLARFDKGRFYKQSIEAPSTVFAILQNRDDFSLWVGTYQGIRRLEYANNSMDVKRITHITEQNGLAGNTVVNLFQAANGDIWLATTDGASLYRQHRITSYTTADGLSSNSVIAFYEDANHDIWLTTRGGITRLKNNQAASLTSRHGLPDDEVYQIIEDARGFLWVATRSGVFRTRLESLIDVLEGRANIVSGSLYTKANGLQTNECNGSAGSAFKGGDGRIWFATTKGAAVVEPSSDALVLLVPPVVIERVTADYREIEDQSNITITPGVRNIEFNYTGLSFRDSENLRFRYRLDGYDKSWIDAGMRRAAFYTNLTPGSYRFRVAVANAEGIWNEREATVELKLLPYFYQTTWFAMASLCALGFTLVFGTWGLYRWRLRQIERRFALITGERTRLAREVHDTLAQGFVGVSTQLEVAAELFDKTPDRALKHLERARQLAILSLHEARRAVVNLRSPALEQTSLIEALTLFANKLTVNSDQRINIKATGNALRLPDDLEYGLLRIGQEAITNAMRHAAATHIAVTLSYQPQSITLSVRDDGRGFNPHTPPMNNLGGYGIDGMRERAEDLGGTLEVNTAPDSGTEIIACLPTSPRKAERVRPRWS